MKNIVRSLFVVSSFAALAACSLDTSKSDGAGGTTPTPAPVPAAPATGTDPMAPAPMPAAGMAIVRVIHASADAPSVDVYVKGSAAPIVTALTYGQTSGWLDVPPGSYEFELRAAPSKPSDPIA